MADVFTKNKTNIYVKIERKIQKKIAYAYILLKMCEIPIITGKFKKYIKCP